MKIKKILITGSSGTVGTALFERFLEENYEVFGVDKKQNKWDKKLDKLTIKADLLKKNDFKKIPKKIDLIVHSAANARVFDSVLNPNLAIENILMTYNVLEFARKNNIKKIIFFSSREIYGNRTEKKIKEKDANFRFTEGPYAASKIAGESLFWAYKRCYGIDFIIFRLSNVYGKYDDSERFIPLLIKRMMKNLPVFIFGKDKILDFTYIQDCVEGISLGVKKFEKAKNNVFNLAFGKGVKLIKVAELIKRGLKSKSKIKITKPRPSEVIKYTADISKIKKNLAFEPKVSIKKGINLSLGWYLNLWRKQR